MATPTMQRKPVSVGRGSAAPVPREQYSYGRARSAGVEVSPYTTAYPQPVRRPAVPRPGAPQKKPAVRTKSRAGLLRHAWKVAGVFLLCCLMIYRYAVIVESNDRIRKLNEEYAAIEASNQAIESKIERGLELGALEEYATTQRGMVRPDTTQIFYVDLQLGDKAQNISEQQEEAEGNLLQGTPGALVHAFQVLK